MFITIIIFSNFYFFSMIIIEPKKDWMYVSRYLSFVAPVHNVVQKSEPNLWINRIYTSIMFIFQNV